MKGVQCYELFGVIALKNHVCFLYVVIYVNTRLELPSSTTNTATTTSSSSSCVGSSCSCVGSMSCEL